MGLFLQTAIIKNTHITQFEKCMRELLTEYPAIYQDSNHFKFLNYEDAVGVLLSQDVIEYDSLVQMLSIRLHAKVLFLYIYDSDYWGYYLYDDGLELDRFSPIRNYFSDEESEIEKYKGNAAIIAENFGMDVKNIERYLYPWTDSILDQKKAYPEDEFEYGDCWQMADFMKSLGYPYAYETADSKEDSSPLSLPTLEEVLLHKLPAHELPSQGFQHPAYHYHSSAYHIGNLPNALDYEYVYGLLQNGTHECLKTLGSMEIGEAMQTLRNITIDKADYKDPALYTILAFCNHWYGYAEARYWSLYSALDLAPNDIMLLRARGLIAAVPTKRHVGIKDMTTLLSLDPENRDLYLLCRAFYCHENPKWDMACADVRELLEIGIPNQNDPRVVWAGFTKEFEQFVLDIKNSVPIAHKKSSVDLMREEFQAKREQRLKKAERLP